jgi:hypothetical protein
MNERNLRYLTARRMCQYCVEGEVHDWERYAYNTCRQSSTHNAHYLSFFLL